jgi:transcriptional antiterminator RfaH
MAIEWYCVYTLPRSEFLAVAHMMQQGFEAFCPTYLRRYTSKKAPAIKPLFSRYAFVAFDLLSDPWKKIVSTRGVRQLFSHSENCPVALPPGAIDEIKSMSNMDDPERPILFEGCRVRILKGAFAVDHQTGMLREGFVTWTDQQRVALLMSWMQREVVLMFDRANVELVQ